MLETTLPVEFQWAQAIITIIAGGILVLAGFVYGAYRWCYGPRFRVGVPPTISEQTTKRIPFRKMGKKSIISQFRHSGACMAKPYGNKESLTKRNLNSLMNDRMRCRTLLKNPDNHVLLPVVIENYGRRTAKRYALGVSFMNPKVHVTAIDTEGANVGTLYAVKPELVCRVQNGAMAVPKAITDAYDNYMELDDDFGDIIYLDGALDGWMYEMILIDVLLEENVKNFVVSFSINWEDGSNSPARKKQFLQAFKLIEPSGPRLNDHQSGEIMEAG